MCVCVCVCVCIQYVSKVWSDLSVSPLSVQHVLRVSLRQALGRGFVSFAPPTATPTVPATLCVSVALDTTERRETQLTPPAQVSHTHTHTQSHTLGPGWDTSCFTQVPGVLRDDREPHLSHSLDTCDKSHQVPLLTAQPTVTSPYGTASFPGTQPVNDS